MLSPEQKEQIATQINNFREIARIYLSTKEKLDLCEKSIEEQNNRLSDVAKEDRQMEMAVDILYRQIPKTSRAKDIEMDISRLKEMCNHHLDELNAQKTKITELMRNLPVPVDLDRPQGTNSEVSFRYFENLEFETPILSVLSQLIRQEMPL